MIKEYWVVWRKFLFSLGTSSRGCVARALESRMGLEKGRLDDSREYRFARNRYCFLEPGLRGR